MSYRIVLNRKRDSDRRYVFYRHHGVENFAFSYSDRKTDAHLFKTEAEAKEHIRQRNLLYGDDNFEVESILDTEEISQLIEEGLISSSLFREEFLCHRTNRWSRSLRHSWKFIRTFRL